MKKLLNTLYITQEDVYLGKEGENFVILRDGKIIARFPVHILKEIFCFSYIGCSPQAMKTCMENNILLAFFTPQGRFCGRVIGQTNGNVLLRREQYRIAEEQQSIDFARNIIFAKAYNSKRILQRALRDHAHKIDEEKVRTAIKSIDESMAELKTASDKDRIRGLEGSIAQNYFACFDELITQQKETFTFTSRNRRPPLDRVNAMLSFLYSLLNYEIVSALEGVGIDSYVGFFHTDRPGRTSMALDLIEEMRGFMVDRIVLNMINLSIINAKHFEIKDNGAVLLNDKGRKVVLTYWQERKHQEIVHPFIQETISIGLLPHVQSLLLNRYIRGDLEAYPPFLMKG